MSRRRAKLLQKRKYQGNKRPTILWLLAPGPRSGSGVGAKAAVGFDAVPPSIQWLLWASQQFYIVLEKSNRKPLLHFLLDKAVFRFLDQQKFTTAKTQSNGKPLLYRPPGQSNSPKKHHRYFTELRFDGIPRGLEKGNTKRIVGVLLFVLLMCICMGAGPFQVGPKPGGVWPSHTFPRSEEPPWILGSRHLPTVVHRGLRCGSLKLRMVCLQVFATRFKSCTSTREACWPTHICSGLPIFH